MKEESHFLDITDDQNFYMKRLFKILLSLFFLALFLKLRMKSTNTFLIFSHADIKQGGKAEERKAALVDRRCMSMRKLMETSLHLNFPAACACFYLFYLIKKTFIQSTVC